MKGELSFWASFCGKYHVWYMLSTGSLKNSTKTDAHEKIRRVT